MVAMPDGSVATLLDKDSIFVAAIIKRNGEVMLSDACNKSISYVDFLSITPTTSNELFIYCPNSWNGFVCKINNNGKIVYVKKIDTNISQPCVPLDNGGFAMFYGNYMEVYDNKGEYTGFKYEMEYNDDDFKCKYAFAADDDNFFLCDNAEYRIFNSDGSFVGSGQIDSISNIRYVDGYIYVISHLEKEEKEDDDDLRITKMDALGNQIFNIYIESMSFFDCCVGHDNTFIVTGVNQRDGNGVIYLYDNGTGSPKYGNSNDTILMKYDDCFMIPYVVAPDRYGEYDVYAGRWNYYEQEDYDDEYKEEYKEGGYKEWGNRLYIYHTDDLHKLYTE